MCVKTRFVVMAHLSVGMQFPQYRPAVIPERHLQPLAEHARSIRSPRSCKGLESRIAAAAREMKRARGLSCILGRPVQKVIGFFAQLRARQVIMREALKILK